MKQLSKQGVVQECQQAKPITVQEEDDMWNSGLLGDNMPEKLFNTLLYLIGIHFALHACDEHKALKTGAFGQLKVKVDPQSGVKFLKYTEHQSKAYQGGLKSIHDKPKVVRAFQNCDDPKRCIVHIFEKYLAKRPSHDLNCSCDLYF